MQINFLELENYRNYESLSVEFNPQCNIIYGANAQGKTNILESIYMCAWARSHKGSKEREIIKRGSDEAHIKAEFEGNLSSHRIDIHLKKNSGKGIALNRIPIKKKSELYGHILVIMFSSEDLDIVKRSPLDRRNYMDMILCQSDPLYLDELIGYGRLLNQRKELLKRFDDRKESINDLNSMLDIYDLQLSEYGKKIIIRRKQFIDELNSYVNDIHAGLTEGKEDLKVIYDAASDEDELYENLIKNREKDKIYKQTHTGPHRDDLRFFEGKNDLKIYGSNGQQRSCAISLKLAEIKIIEHIKKEKPVLLLDDVLSELDRSRQVKLLSGLNGIQTLITCTGLDEFVKKEIPQADKIEISCGALKNIERI